MTTTERQATDRIAWFSELDRDDVALVGGTSVNLGELTVPDCRYQNASSLRLRPTSTRCSGVRYVTSCARSRRIQPPWPSARPELALGRPSSYATLALPAGAIAWDRPADQEADAHRLAPGDVCLSVSRGRCLLRGPAAASTVSASWVTTSASSPFQSTWTAQYSPRLQ